MLPVIKADQFKDFACKRPAGDQKNTSPFAFRGQSLAGQQSIAWLHSFPLGRFGRFGAAQSKRS
jgi:hypothetical protein